MIFCHIDKIHCVLKKELVFTVTGAIMPINAFCVIMQAAQKAAEWRFV